MPPPSCVAAVKNVLTLLILEFGLGAMPYNFISREPLKVLTLLILEFGLGAMIRAQYG